jgi:predicted PurR-regulated permease PerM
VAAVLEGIIGTLFLAILIAKLVGVYPPPQPAEGTGLAGAKVTMKPSGDITRVVLMVPFIVMLLTSLTLLPFLGGLIWAATVVIATWPLLLRVAGEDGQTALGGRAGHDQRRAARSDPAFRIRGQHIAGCRASRSEVLGASDTRAGPATRWLGRMPVVGDQLIAKWQALAASGREGLVERAAYLLNAAQWAVSITGGIGAVTVQILLTIILVAILYSQGETAARGALALGFHGRRRGMDVMRLAAQAVRSVALGVVVTALVQSVLTGLALWICGIPAAGVLAALVFMLGIAQLGPLPIMLPAIAWLYWTDQYVWGTVLLILAIPIGALDNVLRPILIRRGVQLPMLLIIAGVIGGLIGFGVMGLFIGPVLLASTYTLAKSWVAEGPKPGIPRRELMKFSINWLLVFIPVTLVLEHAGGVTAPVIFFSAALSIVPSPGSSCGRPGRSPRTPAMRSAAAECHVRQCPRAHHRTGGTQGRPDGHGARFDHRRDSGQLAAGARYRLPARRSSP